MKHILLLLITAIVLLFAAPCMAVDQTFRFEDASATKVDLAGEFNGWHAQAMDRGADGVWTLTIDIPPGTHGYKFLVNDEVWMLDASNPNRKSVDGAENSAVTVVDVAAAAPALSASGEWTFSYRDPQAQAVFVTGSFNGWNTDANPMTKKDEGVWTATVSLPPGETTYKFIVDGQWKTDPSNPSVVEDGQGGQNSSVRVGESQAPAK